MYIRQLEDDILAKKVYTWQVARGYLGLAKETATICKELHIEDCNTTKLSKAEYKSMPSQFLTIIKSKIDEAIL